MAPKRSADNHGHRTPKKSKRSGSQLSLHNFFRSPNDSSVQGCSSLHSNCEFGDRISGQDMEKGERSDSDDTRYIEVAWKDKQLTSDKGKGKEAIESANVNDFDDVKSGITNRTLIHHNRKPMPCETPSTLGPYQLISLSGSRSEVAQLQTLSTTSFPDLGVDPLTFTEKVDDPASVSSYAFIAYTLSIISQTRSRILILNILTNCLRTIIFHHPTSLLPVLYLMTNTLSPSYIPVELKIGPSIISKAIQQVSGLTSSALSKLYKALGDPGDVAFAAKSSVRTLIAHPPLTIIGVYETLLRISNVQGQGAAKIKQSFVEKLLLSAKGEESRYIVRTLFQNLRVGAVRTTLIMALARAMVFCSPVSDANQDLCYTFSKILKNIKELEVVDGKKQIPSHVRQEIQGLYYKAESVLKSAFVIHPNLNDISKALLDNGLDDLLNHIQLTVGTPLHPTLGSPMRSLEEIYERLGDLPFTAEFKYDGQRAQLHAVSDGSGNAHVKIFSRHLEDMTDKYPDVVALARLLLLNISNAAEICNPAFIMDAEIVAIDVNSGELKSFQDLSQRARKDVKIEDIKVAVGVFGYDLMFLNGKPLIELSFRERRNLFRKYIPPFEPESPTIARLHHAESCDSDEGEEAIESFWRRAISGRSEGLMIKVLNHGEMNESDISKKRKKPLPASYQPDKRTMAWLKLKKDYVIGIADSLDLVPIGAWHGNGRKAQWWSPILLAVWDHKDNEFVAVCKCMSGFSDKFYKEMKTKYAEDSENCSSTAMWNCNVGGFKPSVYFRPLEVWEVRGADITMSPVSVAAKKLVPGGRGLSLRFPRFIKAREDKGPEEASSPEFLANLWGNQKGRGPGTDYKQDDDGDLLDVDWETDPGEEDKYEDI